jgi:hypothetical protein
MHFCKRCHKQVKLPDFLKQANVQGRIIFSCPLCKKGKVIVEPKKEVKKK